MPCSVFENDETVKGWKVGSSVAYYEPCFREVVVGHEEKVEYNNSNESGKKRSTEARRKVFDKEKINYGAKIWYLTQAFLFLRT